MRTEQEIRARLEELVADIRLTYEPASVTINAPLALEQCAITSMTGILTWVLEPRNLDFVNAEWVKKYCDMTIAEETERFERDTRPRNDAYANGSYSGYVHALNDLKTLLERMECIAQNERDPYNWLERNDVGVELDESGSEGINGDYDPDDPTDVHLLRFYFFKRINNEWVDIDDASYCTQVPATISRNERRQLLELLMDIAYDACNAYPEKRVKRIMEELSWVSMDSLSQNRVEPHTHYDWSRHHVSNE
jgi:hypothetical protein